MDHLLIWYIIILLFSSFKEKGKLLVCNQQCRELCDFTIVKPIFVMKYLWISIFNRISLMWISGSHYFQQTRIEYIRPHCVSQGICKIRYSIRSVKMFFSSFAKVAGIPQNFLKKFVTYQRQGCREFLLDSSDPAILTQIDQNGYFCFGFMQILIWFIGTMVPWHQGGLKA